MLDKTNSADTDIDFSANAEFAWTLPAHTYFEPDWFEQEKKLIFRRNWRFVGHISDIQSAGDYITHFVADQPIFVIRDKTGEINGYHNACKHRAHLLFTELTGSSSGPLITCPYHAWAYDHSGQLQSAPHCEAIKGFRKQDFTLTAIKVEVIAGLIFVNLDINAQSLSEKIAPGLDRFLGLVPDMESYRRCGESVFDVKANWKNVGDNLLECYHCHPSHKAFVDLVDMDSYLVETADIWSWQGGLCRINNSAYNLPDLISERDKEFVTFFIWPDMALVRFAGSDTFGTFTFEARCAELTRQKFTHYSRDGALDNVTEDMMRYFNDVLGPEDISLVENVQLGLHSDSYSRGRFMVDSERSYYSEHAVHHFHSLVMQFVKSP